MSHEGIRTVVNVYRYFVSYTKHFEISSALRCRNLIICYTFECEDIKIHIPCLLSTENTRIESIDHVFVHVLISCTTTHSCKNTYVKNISPDGIGSREFFTS